MVIPQFHRGKENVVGVLVVQFKSRVQCNLVALRGGAIFGAAVPGGIAGAYQESPG